MALDRAWYNALVDDDGSNTVGTVWGKDDVDALMDVVDLEIARIEGPWVAFTPPLYATAGTWTGSANSKIKQNGKTMMMQYAIENGIVSAATTELHLALQTFAKSGPVTPMFTAAYLLNGVWEIGLAYIPSAGSVLSFLRQAGAWPATTGLAVRGTVIYEVA